MNDVLVIGAGLAGLTCARRLKQEGIEAIILETSDAVGGRVRTDNVDGFLIDRGFQVLLTAYPEAQRWLDYDALDLCEFPPGAAVRVEGKWSRVADPRRRWSDLLASLTADIGSTADKLRVLKWAVEANSRDGLKVFQGEEESSLARLRRRGFSPQMIDRFWRPWLSGIYLESELVTSSRMLEFVFEMFTKGKTAVPRAGMQAIPEQLAAGLKSDQVRLNTRVAQWEQGRVWDSAGQVYPAEHIVLALDAGGAARLTGNDATTEWRSAEALYFEAPKAPMEDPLLMLNGDQTGVINHLADLTSVNAQCAPVGKTLIMVGIRPGTVLDPLVLQAEAQKQLREWFGGQVESWRLIRHSVVPEALPVRPSLQFVPPRPIALGLWQCGDYTSTASIQGAMESGRMVAEAILDWR